MAGKIKRRRMCASYSMAEIRKMKAYKELDPSVNKSKMTKRQLCQLLNLPNGPLKKEAAAYLKRKRSSQKKTKKRTQRKTNKKTAKKKTTKKKTGKKTNKRKTNKKTAKKKTKNNKRKKTKSTRKASAKRRK